MTLLGLYYCSGALSSHGEWGPPLSCSAQAPHYDGVSLRGAQTPGIQASAVVACGPRVWAQPL